MRKDWKAALIAALLLWLGSAAMAAPSPFTVSKLWVDADGDGVRENDGSVGRTGDVLELDAPSGVKLQDSGVDILTADATGVTLSGDLELVNLTLTGTLTGTSVDLSSFADAAGGFRVNGTEFLDSSLNLDNINNVTGTSSFVRANTPTFVTPVLGAATGTSVDLSSFADAAGGFRVAGTTVIDGSRNVSNVNNATGTGNVVFSASPTFTGTVTGAALDFSGEVQADSLSINGTTVIDDARELTVITGTVTSQLDVGSLSSSGGISGTTGTYTGNLTTTADVGAGTATPSRPLHAVNGAGTVPGETIAGATVALFQNNASAGDRAFISVVGGNGGSGQSGLLFGDADDENVCAIYYDHNANSLLMRTNAGSTAFTIDSGGDATFAQTATAAGLISSAGLRVASPSVPSSASDTGTTGDIAWDSDYVYVCTATNTWKRAAIATW